MADTQRILHDYIPPRAYPVKGSVTAIQVGDLLFFDATYQGITQHTVRPSSAGSAGASAADGRYQFAQLFVGCSHQRHEASSFNKDILISVDAEIDIQIANLTGVATAATAEAAPGTNVGVAVTAAFVPIVDKVVVSGLHSVTVADNEAIGKVSRQVKNGDKLVRVHLKGVHVMSQVGV